MEDIFGYGNFDILGTGGGGSGVTEERVNELIATQLLEGGTIKAKLDLKVDKNGTNRLITEEEGTKIANALVASDISGKADTSYVNTQLALKANTADLATVATTGSYNDLTNKPTIPDKTSQLTNDSGYLTEHQSLSGYATESWVEGKGYLTEHQDITGKADKTYVDTQIATKSNVVVSATGTATDEVSYITIDGVEKKIAGGTTKTMSVSITECPSSGYLNESVTVKAQIIKGEPEFSKLVFKVNEVVKEEITTGLIDQGIYTFTYTPTTSHYSGNSDYIQVIIYDTESNTKEATKTLPIITYPSASVSHETPVYKDQSFTVTVDTITKGTGDLVKLDFYVNDVLQETKQPIVESGIYYFSYTPTETGELYFNVKITASDCSFMKPEGYLVEVLEPQILGVTITECPDSKVINSSVTVKAKVTKGSSNLSSLELKVNDVVKQTITELTSGSTYSLTYTTGSTTGTDNILVTLTDASSATKTATDTIEIVNAPSASFTSLPEDSEVRYSSSFDFSVTPTAGTKALDKLELYVGSTLVKTHEDITSGTAYSSDSCSIPSDKTVGDTFDIIAKVYDEDSNVGQSTATLTVIDSIPGITITECPSTGTVGSTVTVKAKITKGTLEFNKLELRVNSTVKQTITENLVDQGVYTLTYAPDTTGSNYIQAVIYDSSSNMGADIRTITVSEAPTGYHWEIGYDSLDMSTAVDYGYKNVSSGSATSITPSTVQSTFGEGQAAPNEMYGYMMFKVSSSAPTLSKMYVGSTSGTTYDVSNFTVTTETDATYGELKVYKHNTTYPAYLGETTYLFEC